MTADASAPAPILEMRRISKQFPGVKALSDVSISVGPGQIHAVAGENGAGKSTLMKVLSGVYPHGSYDGEIRFEGRERRFAGIADSEACGIIIIHQELALVPLLSIAENVFLGNEPSRFGFVQHERMHVETQKVLERFKLEIDPTVRVGELGMGQKQLVEIARALAKHARILILDEPTSALSDKEVRALLAIIQELRAAGVSSIYISHKLDEVFQLADRITVLRDGQSVFTTPSRAGSLPRKMFSAMDSSGTSASSWWMMMIPRASLPAMPRKARGCPWKRISPS